MKTILYHGSKNRIEKPIYGYGSRHNDYGLGFYCTLQPEMAKEWAVSEWEDGFANQYEFEDDGLAILDLTGADYSILHWLTMLLQNRTFNVLTDFGREARQYMIDTFGLKTKTYDVIRGYRADDSYFSFAQDFLNNAISLKTLSRAMSLGKLGEQTAIMSERAFSRLTFMGAEIVDRREWFPLKEARDRQARRDYFRSRDQKWSRGEIYMMQILDQEMGADDARLR